MTSQLTTHVGSCHCGKVRFEVDAPRDLVVVKCSCSICVKKQNLHFIVPANRFRLLQGEDALTTYRFGTGQAKHTFCSTCGVQSFYYPRSNPDGVGIMPHCLEQNTVGSIRYKEFDGKNWESAMETDTELLRMSKE